MQLFVNYLSEDVQWKTDNSFKRLSKSAFTITVNKYLREVCGEM